MYNLIECLFIICWVEQDVIKWNISHFFAGLFLRSYLIDEFHLNWLSCKMETRHFFKGYCSLYPVYTLKTIKNSNSLNVAYTSSFVLVSTCMNKYKRYYLEPLKIKEKWLIKMTKRCSGASFAYIHVPNSSSRAFIQKPQFNTFYSFWSLILIIGSIE